MLYIYKVKYFHRIIARLTLYPRVWIVLITFTKRCIKIFMPILISYNLIGWWTDSLTTWSVEIRQLFLSNCFTGIIGDAFWHRELTNYKQTHLCILRWSFWYNLSKYLKIYWHEYIFTRYIVFIQTNLTYFNLIICPKYLLNV